MTRDSKGKFAKKEPLVQLHGRLAQQAKDEKWMPIRKWELAGAKGQPPVRYSSMGNCAFCQHYYLKGCFECPLYGCGNLVEACEDSHDSTPMLAVLEEFIEEAGKERELAPVPETIEITQKWVYAKDVPKPKKPRGRCVECAKVVETCDFNFEPKHVAGERCDAKPLPDDSKTISAMETIDHLEYTGEKRIYKCNDWILSNYGVHIIFSNHDGEEPCWILRPVPAEEFNNKTPEFKVGQDVIEPVLGLCQICKVGDGWCHVKRVSETIPAMYTISACNLRLARLSDYEEKP